MSLRKRLAWRSRAERRTNGGPGPWHVHWFRHVGDDPYGPDGLYACRCGEARSGL